MNFAVLYEYSPDKEKIAALGLPIAGINDIIATHLTETIKSNMRELVTRSAVGNILNEFTKVSDPKRAERNKKILDEFIIRDTSGGL